MDVVRAANVVDLFAGTGALGIEALSRGATRVTFVDAARASVECVRSNLVATGMVDSATVVQRDVLAAVADGPEAFGGPVDLVLADPPYAFDRWADLFAALEPVLAEGAVVVAESGRSLSDLVAEEAGADQVRESGAHGGGSDRVGWSILRERRYGGTVVSMLTFDRTGDGS